MINSFSRKQLEQEINRFLIFNNLPEVHNLTTETIERVYPVLCGTDLIYQGNLTDKFSKVRTRKEYSLEEKIKVAKSLY